MAYEKTNWSSGDVITAEKLNNLEDGVETTNPFEIHFTMDFENPNQDGSYPVTSDKTFAEILAEFNINALANSVTYVEGKATSFHAYVTLSQPGGPVDMIVLQTIEQSGLRLNVFAINVGSEEMKATMSSFILTPAT